MHLLHKHKNTEASSGAGGGGLGVVQRSTRKWWFYDGKVRDPGAEHLPGAAWVSGWARGRSAEVFRSHLGSSGEGFGDHFESKIVLSGSKPSPGRFLRVER